MLRGVGKVFRKIHSPPLEIFLDGRAVSRKKKTSFSFELFNNKFELRL